MGVTKVVQAGKSKDQWVYIDDVPGEAVARVKVQAVTDLGHGMVQLTIRQHPTLGTWKPQYHKLHNLRLAG
jgi:hypothetical protein